MDQLIRKATPEDSSELAELMNLAGEGIPAYLWGEQVAPGEDVMEFGARRVARTEGGFSYTNAHVATIQGVIAGMLLSYRLPDPYEIGSLEAIPPVVRPLMQLEALVPGSWYVNAIATDSAYRGQGVGSRLMQLAEQLAADSGAEALSLIVAEDNIQARALYERLGYQRVARRAIIQFPCCPHAGDWVLMKKEVKR
ncbi:GNAT family N-acetyltransferase [Halomonas heilongjiangensis]|uniref:GNAT family N-acetyltransferase n=1 Tax=Halomonas heilongjiangensis TaxID=1387883 RepID=A0A2N7TJD5_9GAMM|nr:GNAT family N-acetyltransferase [Halomonas heilongjiangensis]PMR68290.1 GNAT family N-acetyltransferase [Halomonas heilongjiangensis]PXX93140.1 GNAT family N-acetyltransferase [Halomonas heilongjiangensis]